MNEYNLNEKNVNNKKEKEVILFLLIILVLVLMFLFGCFIYHNHKDDNGSLNNNTESIDDLQDDNLEPIGTDLVEYQLPSVVSEKMNKEFKVLIIEIDPVLTKGTIQGVSCKGKTASECLRQDKAKAVEELIDDLNTSSNNNLNVKIVKTEKINEFATYKNSVELLNNKTAYRLDEDTWLDIMKNGWYNGVSDPRVEKIGHWFGTYDYEYIIKKLNLVERRNADEFDEVWIVNVDPSLTFESVLVGSNAFWLNGDPFEKNCSPFKMVNVSISRPDTNYECFGHATEELLNVVFESTYWADYNPLNWDEDSVTIDADNYSKLNLFQKFMLTDHENTNKNSGYAGVGNIHFSPNSTKDYEWNNKNKNVYSKYNEWSNYPNLTNDKSTTIFYSSVYMNQNISGTKSDARLHHRWWFSLLPHHSGFTSDGYYNNWWKYYISNKYVKEIEPVQNKYTYKKNDKLNIGVKLIYSDGSVETINNIKYDTNVEIEDKSLFTIDEDRNLYAKTSGTTKLKYYRDGVYASVNITIK